MTIASAMLKPADMPDAAGAADVHVVPLDFKTLPELLGATNVGADVPLPKMTLFAVRVVRLVPPLATGSAVPEYVIANVPDVVIGLPAILKMLGTVAATLVTVPLVAAVKFALTTAAPAPAPSLYTIVFAPVAIVTVAPEPCLMMML